MKPHAARVLLLILVAALLPTLGGAQTIPKDKGAARTFAQFHFLCLRHLPDLDGVERAAGFGEYDQLLGEDLAPYTPDEPFEKLFGWRFHDHGDELILTAMRSKPDEAFKKEMPAYAATTRNECALRVPNKGAELLLGELTRSIQRAPDKSWRESGLQVYSWTHQAADALSNIQLRVPQGADAKAVLEASVYSNK